MVLDDFTLQGNSLVFYLKMKITLVNFHPISLLQRNRICIHQRHILYNQYFKVNFLNAIIFNIDTSGRDRTGTPLREPDFESGASANSATLAKCDIKRRQPDLNR